MNDAAAIRYFATRVAILSQHAMAEEERQLRRDLWLAEKRQYWPWRLANNLAYFVTEMCPTTTTTKHEEGRFR